MSEELLAVSVFYRDTNVCARRLKNLRQTMHGLVMNMQQRNKLAGINLAS
jgi:hypothetical protein